MVRIIYDFGANNGDDVDYYLRKADTVVAVEANPELCSRISDRFASYVAAGRLFVENCVLSVEHRDTSVEFYIHRSDHTLSRLPKPDDRQMRDFKKVVLTARRPIDIINQYGTPYYIKIDIEFYDHVVLKSLFDEGITPQYLSVECHSPIVLGLLLSRPDYKAFKSVNGRTVSKEYERSKIINRNGEIESYSFPHHSAGPFGLDLKGEWFSPANFVRYLGMVGFGWRDIHVSRTDEPNPHVSIGLFEFCVSHCLKSIHTMYIRLVKGLRRLAKSLTEKEVE